MEQDSYLKSVNKLTNQMVDNYRQSINQKMNSEEKTMAVNAFKEVLKNLVDLVYQMGYIKHQQESKESQQKDNTLIDELINLSDRVLSSKKII